MDLRQHIDEHLTVKHADEHLTVKHADEHLTVKHVDEDSIDLDEHINKHLIMEIDDHSKSKLSYQGMNHAANIYEDDLFSSNCMENAPEGLAKSFERFLLGNVI
ncbi:MAG: hypothetical protein GY874_14805 [Desulfobacteraceae bacterium]|nr:hypothetical protein [Desulfobacteraceae bacterium]